MLSEFKLIQSLSELKSLSKQLAKEELLGVDVEADSFHHYFAKVCLIQISTRQRTFVVDPLTIQSIEALRPLFESHRIKKIFHGADYDLRSLFRDFAMRVENLFDTMVAAQFVGEKEAGLAAVLRKRFGVVMNKKYQKADWSKRPLGHDMLVYAANDTSHLIRLYQELEKELKSKERLGWVEEECKHLEVECTHKMRPGSVHSRTNPPLFKRFKGAGRMTPRNLAILERLLAFRERRAVKQDRPPFKVFGNHVIKELVKTKPRDLSALREMPGLPGHFVKRYAKGVLGCIRSGLELPEESLPSYPRTQRPPRDAKKQTRLKILKTWRAAKASQLELDPGLICNNTLLGALAECAPKDVGSLKTIPGIREWQRNAFGAEIIEVLGSQTSALPGRD